MAMVSCCGLAQPGAGQPINRQAFPAGTAFAAGSDAPEKSEVRVGFVVLTDCAPVVMAAAKGFDAKYGIRIVPTRGFILGFDPGPTDGGRSGRRQILYGLVYGLELGIGGPRQEMADADDPEPERPGTSSPASCAIKA